MMEAEDERRGDGTSIAGTLVRLAWHASGTYSKVLYTECTIQETLPVHGTPRSINGMCHSIILAAVDEILDPVPLNVF